MKLIPQPLNLFTIKFPTSHFIPLKKWFYLKSKSFFKFPPTQTCLSFSLPPFLSFFFLNPLPYRSTFQYYLSFPRCFKLKNTTCKDYYETPDYTSQVATRQGKNSFPNPKVKSNVLPYSRVGNIRIIRKVYTKVHPFEMAEEDWWGEEGDILGRCIVI